VELGGVHLDRVVWAGGVEGDPSGLGEGPEATEDPVHDVAEAGRPLHVDVLG
jgi:hypothetical protein